MSTQKFSYETNNPRNWELVQVLGKPIFTAIASSEFVKTIEEYSKIGTIATVIEESRIFTNAPRIEFKTLEEGKKIQVFQINNPTKDKFVGAYMLNNLADEIIDEKLTLIRTLHRHAQEKAESRLMELAGPIKNETIYEIQAFLKSIVENTAKNMVLSTGQLPKSFIDVYRQGNCLDCLDDMLSIQDKKHAVLDHMSAVNAFVDYDVKLGKDVSRLIHSTLLKFQNCFNKPTQSNIESCVSHVFQIYFGDSEPTSMNDKVMYA